MTLLLAVIKRRGSGRVQEELGWSKSKVSRYRNGRWTEMYEESRTQLIAYLKRLRLLPTTFEYGDELPEEVLAKLERLPAGAWAPDEDADSRANDLVERLVTRLNSGERWPDVLADGYREAAQACFRPAEFAHIDAWRDDELEG